MCGIEFSCSSFNFRTRGALRGLHIGDSNCCSVSVNKSMQSVTNRRSGCRQVAAGGRLNGEDTMLNEVDIRHCIQATNVKH